MIAIEVTDSGRAGVPGAEMDRTPRYHATRAIAQQHGGISIDDGVIGGLGYGDRGDPEVEESIVVEVADGHRNRLPKDGDTGRGRERPVPVAPEQAHMVQLSMATRSSLPSLSKSPTTTEPGRLRAGGGGNRRLERAVGIAE